VNVLRVDVGRTTVLVLPAVVSAETLDELMSEMAECVDAKPCPETIYLDLHKVSAVDERFLTAVRVWARALDDEDIALRVRRAGNEVRALLRERGEAHLLDGD
jgi:ABC-type transporter Mla MlaB component